MAANKEDGVQVVYKDETIWATEGMTLKPGKTMLNWITFTLTNTTPSKDNTKGRLGKGRYLLAITGVCRNEDQTIVKLGGGRISCATADGGQPGRGPVVCEGIPAEITLNGLDGLVECYALDENGDRKEVLPVSSASDGKAVVILKPEYNTVWYELDVN